MYLEAWNIRTFVGRVLPLMNEALSLIPSTSHTEHGDFTNVYVVHAHNPSSEEIRQEGQE